MREKAGAWRKLNDLQGYKHALLLTMRDALIFRTGLRIFKILPREVIL
jgi:hypothetical protein